ncbi:hypothetical protein DPMN_047078 [Dreissena polymorpha]|uniref:Uncharacterized protein n=1 Tax=Dreissena polymorpha TaxID=45954 RepID=A0A9D4D819_DREPO|nr:hypothetical protein DPMN_047078 [Dreissena polymorpha]
MGKERSQAQSEPAVAERDFHNKNCFKHGEICGFYRDSCCARETAYGSTIIINLNSLMFHNIFNS